MSGTLMDAPTDRRLGPIEVAEVLDVHRGSALAWIKSGEIPGGFTMGSRWFVRSENLRAYLTSRGEPTDALDSVLKNRKPRRKPKAE